jgi:hypothetical protein
MHVTTETIKHRDFSLNYFKGFLVIGMIVAHAIQLLTNVGGIGKYFSVYINLVTFSGFMFSFGYIYQAAYSTKEISFMFAIKKMKTTLFAYYISAISWAILVDHDTTWNRMLSIIVLINPSPYSEFLLAFFLMTGVYFSLRPVLTRLTSTTTTLVVTCAILLLLSLIPFGNYYPTIDIAGNKVVADYYIGLLVGSPQSSYFPILQYLIFFILGLSFKRSNINFSWPVLGVSVIGLLLMGAYRIAFHEMPARFPPSPLWIAGSFFFIYIYLLVSKNIKSSWLSSYLNQIGENTIVYLVLSNVFLFALSATGKYTTTAACGFAVAIMLTTGYLVSSSRNFKS